MVEKYRIICKNVKVPSGPDDGYVIEKRYIVQYSIHDTNLWDERWRTKTKEEAENWLDNYIEMQRKLNEKPVVIKEITI